jgi:hypothetical protein
MSDWGEAAEDAGPFWDSEEDAGVADRIRRVENNASSNAWYVAAEILPWVVACELLLMQAAGIFPKRVKHQERPSSWTSRPTKARMGGIATAL